MPKNCDHPWIMESSSTERVDEDGGPGEPGGILRHVRVQAYCDLKERRGRRGTLGAILDQRYPGPFDLTDFGDAFMVEDMTPGASADGWKFRKALGQNSEDLWDGASEPSDSNFIYGRRLRRGRSIARRSVAPGGKAD